MKYLPALEEIELPARSQNLLHAIRLFLRESDVAINDDRSARDEISIDFGIGELKLCIAATKAREYTLSLVVCDELIELHSFIDNNTSTESLLISASVFSKVILTMGVI